MIDTYTQEVLILDVLTKIKKQYRPLTSLHIRWHIHRILPEDSILLEWDNRSKLELELDISQWFSTLELLEQKLWYELMFIRDEMDPLFKYPHSYVQLNYGPNTLREKYFQLIQSIWAVYNYGRLLRQKLPVFPLEIIQDIFHEGFPEIPAAQECFDKLLRGNKEYIFFELENIAKDLHRACRVQERPQE